VCPFVSQLSLIIAIHWHTFCHFPKTPFRAFGGYIKDKKNVQVGRAKVQSFYSKQKLSEGNCSEAMTFGQLAIGSFF